MTEVRVDQGVSTVDVAHLTHTTDEGMELQWESPDGKIFQVTYRGKNAEKAYHLDRILTEAMAMAVERWEEQ